MIDVWYKKKRKYSILTQKRKTIQYSVVKTNERAKNIWYYITVGI